MKAANPLALRGDGGELGARCVIASGMERGGAATSSSDESDRRARVLCFALTNERNDRGAEGAASATASRSFA